MKIVLRDENSGEPIHADWPFVPRKGERVVWKEENGDVLNGKVLWTVHNVLDEEISVVVGDIEEGDSWGSDD